MKTAESTQMIPSYHILENYAKLNDALACDVAVHTIKTEFAETVRFVNLVADPLRSDSHIIILYSLMGMCGEIYRSICSNSGLRCSQPNSTDDDNNPLRRLNIGGESVEE